MNVAETNFQTALNLQTYMIDNNLIMLSEENAIIYAKQK